ncbi:MAG: S41 family peptidase [Chloroflexota bacterium]|nr:MAG: S41 family peptidase [Chloroflexota bacterium]
MKSKLRYIGVVLLVLSVFIFGLAGGVLLDRYVNVANAASVGADTPPNTELLLQAWRIIDRNFVDRDAVESNRLTYGAISGMVDALGDTGHTTFLSPEMLKQHQNYTRGEFEGIGAQVEKKGDYVIITAPMDDSPALKAGLKPGDAILKVNGEDMTGKSVEYAIEKIIGPAGTQVTLTIIDPDDGSQREVTITRAKIKVNDVSWAQVPGTTIGVVRISGFSDGIGAQVKSALEEMKAQKLTGVVLDLRNNPGGLLSEAVTTTSQFLDKGNVLLEKDAQGRIQEVKVEAGGVAADLPMTVLINYGSASASEIVSGALQDANRAKLFGETTFGTGTVLNTFPMSDGSALLLATLEWLTPNGRVIWHQGIQPDDKVSLPAGVAPLTPAQLKTMTPQVYNAARDLQLQHAVDWLTCPNGKCATDAVKFPGKDQVIP